jgi:conjugative relaxase-like TrwC/TraI family protein
VRAGTTSGAGVVADLHKLAVGREGYYTREIARNREEYLSGHGESPGVFHGGSARALGLDGECSPEAFKRLFSWQDPRTGEQLGRAPRADAMPAWDLVFRPHKDVSILYGLGDARTSREVAAAHQAGVRAAVAYLDGHAGTRTGRHGTEHVLGDGLLAVGFTHRTSRAGDPLLHTHLIITNRTQGPDGGWRTLDSRDLLAHRATADAMYRAAYQQELTRSLGVCWEAPDRWGNRAIQGMPEELRRSFSKRHQQISAELERQEAEEGKRRTPRQVQKVVHETRPPKSHQTPETLYGRWQQEARDLGYEPDRLVFKITDRTRAREQDPARTAGQDGASDRTPAGLAEVLTTTAGLPERTVRTMFDRLASPEGLTAQASTFTRRQVLCAVGRELPTDAAGTVGPAELEALADRFLAERAVSVVSEHAAGERHYATPELLAVEQRLIDTAVGRAGEQTGVCSHDTLRATLAAHPTIGKDQAAMVRDITQGGQGVLLVVGKAGTGKTYALGVARHAWQLDGYRVLGAAPTGIATVCLDAEGFEHSRTVDSLLGELDQERADHRRQPKLSLTRQPPPGRDRDTTRIRRAPGAAVDSRRITQAGQDERVLDERTVLVVDEAGMLGSRKLARLLDHAHDAGAKVVLVGDDKQLAAIEAGGGFRGLRLRLGAATLTENRRQAEPWERQAVEHLREGNIDAALAAYREHDRLVDVETPGQLKETMLSDWWQSFQQGKHVVILAYRRDEVDQFNTACQQLRDAQGHLGAERLVVRDRSFAVGDQVVCGKNAITSLGVANGTRGQVVAVDLEQRALTLKLQDGREVSLPGEYLDKRPARWLGNNPDRRTVDLAYASTGHKSQGTTLDEALVRVTSAEDGQWLYVGSTRAIVRTRYYSVISPEPAIRQDRDREQVDVPAADRTPQQQADQLATVARRDGSKRLAADTTARLDLRSMSKHDLRARRDQLAGMIDTGPPDQSRLLDHATTRREQSEQRLAEATIHRQDARDLVAGMEHGPARWLRRGDLARARQQYEQAEQAWQVARQQANRAADRERHVRHEQQRHQAHREANPQLVAEYYAVVREDKWRSRAQARAVELERPEWSRELGERPASIKGGRAWDRAVGQVVEYRQRWRVDDAERTLGPEPHGAEVSLEQRRARRHAERAIGRLRDLAADRTQRPDRTEATGRHPSDQRSDHGRPDHRDRDRERAM